MGESTLSGRVGTSQDDKRKARTRTAFLHESTCCIRGHDRDPTVITMARTNDLTLVRFPSPTGTSLSSGTKPRVALTDDP